MYATCRSATGPTDPATLEYDYDREADVLYVSIGRPQPAICREVAEVEGLHLLHSLADNRICGATVVWYSKQDKQVLRESIPFKVDLP